MPAPVQVQAKVEQRTLDGVLSGLRYVSSPPYARKAFAITKIKERLLGFIRSIFPVSDPRWGRTAHLVSGFRTYDIPDTTSSVGFVLQHRDQKNIRTQAILASLELGSRGYYMRPQFVNDKGFGLFQIFPGKQVGNRHGPGVPDFAMRKRIHIPARAGLHYMERTMEFAERLITEAKPEFFKKVKEEMKKKR
jgi:hypothetical protein